MSLHQRIIDRTTAEPCNCSEDDDHFDYVMVEDELPVEEEVKSKTQPERKPEPERPAEGKGFTTTKDR